MGDPTGQTPDVLEAARLLELFVASSQERRRTALRAQVRQERGKPRGPRKRDPLHLNLDRDLGSIDAAPHEFDGLPQNRRLFGFTLASKT